MRDGYIPVYTAGMVNTRYIPVFLEYSDPSTVSRLRVEPPRAAPVPPRHAHGDAARMLRWAYYSLLARATAGWGAVVGLGVRGRARAARRGSGSPRPSPAAAAYPSTGRPKAKYPVWENGPGYIPVYTGILPYRYIPSEILRPPYKQATNTLPYRVTYPAGGTAVGLMRRLRQLGVRAHFWI